jgi:hypothetical protein
MVDGGHADEGADDASSLIGLKLQSEHSTANRLIDLYESYLKQKFIKLDHIIYSQLSKLVKSFISIL